MAGIKESSQLNKEEIVRNFFSEIIPHLTPLRNYIRMRLESTASSQDKFSSDEILEQSVIQSYRRLSNKPEGMGIKEWTYITADEILDELT